MPPARRGALSRPGPGGEGRAEAVPGPRGGRQGARALSTGTAPLAGSVVVALPDLCVLTEPPGQDRQLTTPDIPDLPGEVPTDCRPPSVRRSRSAPSDSCSAALCWSMGRLR
jgi:hypothetical protein